MEWNSTVLNFFIALHIIENKPFTFQEIILSVQINRKTRFKYLMQTRFYILQFIFEGMPSL